MYISTEINSFKALGTNERVLQLLKDAGFDAYDYTTYHGSLAEGEVLSHPDYLSRAAEFRRKADAIGIVCNQAHAPYPSAIDEEHPRFGMRAEEYNPYAHQKITRAIEVAGILGAKCIVVHPWNYYTAEQNRQLYLSFETAARRAGVKIAVENMWNCEGKGTENFRATPAACSHHEDFKAHMDLLPKDVYVACVDLGHAEMGGLGTSAVKMVETLGDYVQALHIHDNDLRHDSHGLPYTMQMDFAAALAALKKVGYKGDVTLEAYRFVGKFPLEAYPAAAKLMAEVADSMRKYLLK